MGPDLALAGGGVLTGALAAATPLAGAGVVATALAAAAALLLPRGRARAAAVAAAALLTPLLVLGEVWSTAPVASLRERPALAAGAALVALLAVGGLALVLLRRPALFPVLAVAALPFRLPIEAGGQTANLLVPLYLVVGAGCLAYLWRHLHPRATGDGDAPGADPRRQRLEAALALVVVLYALQSLYSTDPAQALKNIAFFYAPFALLLTLLREVRWSRRVLLAAGGVAVALALIFVLVGFWEFATRRVLLNPKLIAANQFESYFRVNSLFFDPNIYGRFLAMVMIGLAGALVWVRRPRQVIVIAAALALLWAGLVVSFSQSSFAALLLGLGVIAALRWRARRALAPAAALLLVGFAVVLIAPGLVRLELGSSQSLDRATSGRFDLMRGGVAIFADRPLWGYGSGSFSREYRRRERVSSQIASSASHTIPITVAAEQGVVGLAAYGFVLAAAFRLLFAGLPGMRRRGPPSVFRAARAVVGAAFAALIFHTLVYAAFLEDPIAWALMGAGLALAAAGREPEAGLPDRTGGLVPGARAAAGR